MLTKDRTKFIGGSDVAAAMGLSRWSTPLNLWAEKTGQFEPNDEMSEAMELGIELEDFVAKKFERKSGKKTRRDKRDFTHPDYPYMKAHIDRWIHGGEILECKTCSAWKFREWEGEEIPSEYILQVNWYLGIIGHKTGYIAVLIGGQSFKYKKIEFSQDLFHKQVESVKDFWENYVLTNIPPVAMAGDKDTLVELYPESRSDSMLILRGQNQDFESEVNQLANDKLEGKSQIVEISTEIECVENRLRQLIGINEGIETGQFKVTWKSQNQTRVNTQALKDDGLYEKYSTKTPTRVLRVSEKRRG